MDGDRLLDGLDGAQRAAVTDPGAPLAILAPAGSGKTRVLTRRIAYRVATRSADAGHVLAITFTRRAAGELLHRLGGLGLRDQPAVGTFHGIAWSVLRRRWADQGRRRPPELLAQPQQLLDRLSLPAGRRRRGASPSEWATEIAWAQARLVRPERYEAEAARAGRRPPSGLAAAATVYAAYEEAKRAQHLVDFDDLLATVITEIQRDPSFAEVQRWRFRHLFVDEMQDANPLQLALLDAWRGGRSDLCVVGDPNQAIYEWNGADPRWLQDFAAHQPGATIVRLTTNYRSSPEILRAAVSVLDPVDGEHPLDAAGPPGAPVDVRGYDDEVAEAAGVAALIRSHGRPGRRWSAFAVLVRTHAQVPLIERALRDASIPTRARGGRPLLAHPLVRTLLTGAAAPTGPGALRAFLDDLDEELAAGDAPAILATLAALGRQFRSIEPDASVASFRVWLALGTSGDDETVGGDAVEIVTFHAAKGLEWPIVVIAGLERGLVPHVSATSAPARDEEARLLHVALTRAEHTLHLTWARRRAGSARVLSPLLAPLAVLEEPARPPRRTLARAVDLAGDDGGLAALKAWRRVAARAAGLPETTVCSDGALAAVVAAQPTSIDELAALPEIGPIAARRLGPRLLAVLERVD